MIKEPVLLSQEEFDELPEYEEAREDKTITRWKMPFRKTWWLAMRTCQGVDHAEIVVG